MIVTLTANPSIDRTVQLEQRLERGSVLRAHSTRSDPGGKGVNVARVLAAADLDVLAVLPGIGGDPLLSALAAGGIPHIGVATTGLARTNITIAEPDGTTTKINEPGATLSGSTLDALAQELIARADTALWFALSGSLPPRRSSRVVRRTCRGAARSPVQGSGRHLGRPADGTRRRLPRLGT